MRKNQKRRLGKNRQGRYEAAREHGVLKVQKVFQEGVGEQLC